MADQGDPQSEIPFHVHNGVDSPLIDPTANQITPLPSQTGNAGKFLSTNGTSLVFIAITLPTQVTLIAGQTITGIEPISIGDGTPVNLISSPGGGSLLGSYSSTNNWYSQQFTTSATHIQLNTVTATIASSTSATGQTFTASIFANSGGSPTGAPLYQKTFGINIVVGSNALTFNFNQALSASTTYHVAISIGTNESLMDLSGLGSGTGANQSTNAGSSWSVLTNTTFNITVAEQNNVAGEAYLSSSLANTIFANNFIGFSAASITSGTSGIINVVGIITGLTGLTAGAAYYLQDSVGTIGTTPGTLTRHIGIALSTTSLLLAPFARG